MREDIRDEFLDMNSCFDIFIVNLVVCVELILLYKICFYVIYYDLFYNCF